MMGLFTHHHGMHNEANPVEDCIYRATVSDLVAALQEEGVGATLILDHDLPHGFEIIPNDVREPYMANGRYLVVRIDGEETE